jgi:hypothetical protein
MVGEDVAAENKTKDMVKDDDPTMNVMTPGERARSSWGGVGSFGFWFYLSLLRCCCCCFVIFFGSYGLEAFPFSVSITFASLQHQTRSSRARATFSPAGPSHDTPLASKRRAHPLVLAVVTVVTASLPPAAPAAAEAGGLPRARRHPRPRLGTRSATPGDAPAASSRYPRAPPSAR